MYVEKIKVYERILNNEKYPVPLTPEFLNFVYRFLCKAEKIKPGRVTFYDPAKHTGKHFKDFVSGICLQKSFRILFFPVRRYSIYIDKNRLWLIVLFHEFTHQILMKELKHTGHGKLFKELQKQLFDKYFHMIFLLFNKELKK